MEITDELLNEKYSKYRDVIDGKINYNELDNTEIDEYKQYLEMMKEIGYFERGKKS